MAVQEYDINTTLIQSGEDLTYIALISKGSVRASFPTGELQLKMGDVIGIPDIMYGKHSATYTTLEPTSLYIYPCKSVEELSSIVCGNHDIALLFAASVMRQVSSICDAYMFSSFFSDKLYQYLMESYEDYKKLCLQYAQPVKTLEGLDSIKPLKLEERLDSWLVNYYEALKGLDNQTKGLVFQQNPAICIGFLCKASTDVHRIYNLFAIINQYNTRLSALLLNSQRLDLFALLADLYVTASNTGVDSLALDAMMSRLSLQLQGNPSIDALYYQARLNEYKEIISKAKIQRDAKAALEENDPESITKSTAISALSGSLHTILEYADCSDDIREAFQEKVIAFKQLTDKNSDDDSVRKLRQEIAKLFYKVYASVFQISIRDKNIPPIIKMFLQFGYVDEVLAGIHNSIYLYSLIDHYHGDPENGVYTLYEWLLAIYNGKKEPSRSEFDIDYNAYVHDLKVTGQIAVDIESRMLQDTSQKVIYELNNMFPVVNRMTFGQISTFCPVLCEQNILKSLENALVTPKKVIEHLSSIRNIDFKVFYHESVYSSEKHKIGKEYVHREILPDVILLPNIGTRGVMWQEIEGRNRHTSARMMLSVFCTSELDLLFTRLAGEYRWEICKRIQGTRWNDVSDPSLTSLYTDYLQFYKKNSELSQQAKDQIKLTLQKTKNSFKEAFVRDYIIWIQYESKGSPRLIKLSRGILFQFCPFNSKLRVALSNNPLYSDLIARYALKNKQATEHLAKLCSKITSSGLDVPTEILLEQKYLEL